MGTRVVLTGLVAVLALSLAAVACGGDGGEQPAIRTNKGLAVALAGGQAGVGGGKGGDSAAMPLPATGAVDRLAQEAPFTGGDTGFAGPDMAPVMQQGQSGITVQGYGSATADPDSAILEFYFSRNGVFGPDKPVPMPEPLPPDTSSSSGGSTGAEGQEVVPTPSPVRAITEEELQPVIDAIVGAGVPREKIESISQPYYDPYYASATLRVTVDNLDSIDAVVSAAQGAAGGLENISLTSTNVSYTVKDCSALEKAALEAAVDDANERGAIFAEALGVGLGEVVGASHYSYAPYGGGTCSGNFVGPYPLGGFPYAAGSKASVQVFANVSITFAIK